MEYSCKDEDICDCLCPNTDCIHNKNYIEKDDYHYEQHINN